MCRKEDILTKPCAVATPTYNFLAFTFRKLIKTSSFSPRHWITQELTVRRTRQIFEVAHLNDKTLLADSASLNSRQALTTRWLMYLCAETIDQQCHISRFKPMFVCRTVQRVDCCYAAALDNGKFEQSLYWFARENQLWQTCWRNMFGSDSTRKLAATYMKQIKINLFYVYQSRYDVPLLMK